MTEHTNKSKGRTTKTVDEADGKNEKVFKFTTTTNINNITPSSALRRLLLYGWKHI